MVSKISSPVKRADTTKHNTSFLKACELLRSSGLQIELASIQGLPVWKIRQGVQHGNS
jgi:hypothetical protein